MKNMQKNMEKMEWEVHQMNDSMTENMRIIRYKKIGDLKLKIPSIEEFAIMLHEAGREAVLQKKTVTNVDLKIKTPNKFIEWKDLSEAAKGGRRIQARFLLKFLVITFKEEKI